MSSSLLFSFSAESAALNPGDRYAPSRACVFVFGPGPSVFGPYSACTPNTSSREFPLHSPICRKSHSVFGLPATSSGVFFLFQPLEPPHES